MAKHYDDEVINNRLPEVLDRVACSRHKATLGVPCWHVPADHGRHLLPAICNDRAKKAGFHANIHVVSLGKSTRHG